VSAERDDQFLWTDICFDGSLFLAEAYYRDWAEGDGRRGAIDEPNAGAFA
jgi:hypothetical protein